MSTDPAASPPDRVGPSPLVRGVVGLLLGVAVGALARWTTTGPSRGGEAA